jgi:hypothetical protein
MSMLVLYEEIPVIEAFSEFIEALETSDLKFLSSDLLQHFGFEDEHSVDDAIRRAITACISLDIPYHRHFRHIYLNNGHEVEHAWRLSSFGCYLTLVNEDPSHPVVARMQAALFLQKK